MRRCTVGWAIHICFTEIMEDCKPSCVDPMQCPQYQLQEELREALKEKERQDYMLQQAASKIDRLTKENNALTKRIGSIELALAQAHAKYKRP